MHYCKECGKRTREGAEEDRKRYREHPIWKTDFSKPLSVLIEDVRKEISQVRGKLTDITFGYDCSSHGYYQTIKDVEGLLTCALVNLAYVRKERVKHEEMFEAAKMEDISNE